MFKPKVGLLKGRWTLLNITVLIIHKLSYVEVQNAAKWFSYCEVRNRNEGRV